MKHLLLLASMAVALCTGSATAARAADAHSPVAPAMDPGNLRAFIALARADLKAEKTLIIAQNIEFTGDEAAGFWPLHSDYTEALNRLLDERLILVGDYAANYRTMTDRQAADLAHKVFDLEAKRVKLKRTWFKKFAKVVPAKKAAQFFQIENQLNAALDLQFAAAIPLIR
ncbi:MAG: hypothetical protein IT581_22455 [Verrucomicrobiales bacterium]|nr:hypothetical protein [Verrucomicrobiales bacterium]